jgi:Skp family chaperone for outer membrane proteins
MKSSFQKLQIVSTVVGFCLVLLPAVTAWGGDAFQTSSPAPQRIGTVDLQKVFEKYYKTARSTEDLKSKATEMQKERKEMEDAEIKLEEEWQKLIDKAEDQALSADERGKSKKLAEAKLVDIKTAKQALQQYDMASSSKIRELERERRDNIVKEIRGVLNAQAKADGYTLVLDVSGESANMAPVVLYTTGVNDLTESLIKELNAAELATPAPAPGPDKSAKATNLNDTK